MAANGNVTIYWRPGCGFCQGLFNGLERLGYEPDARVNIWEDTQGSAYVRSVANGNEVVPTVRIGDVGLVNPSVDQLLAVLQEQAPDKVPSGWTPKAPGKTAKFLNKMLGGDS